jgi:hypothetical protein
MALTMLAWICGGGNAQASVELSAVEPSAVEPSAVEPGAVEPGAVEPGADTDGQIDAEFYPNREATFMVAPRDEVGYGMPRPPHPRFSVAEGRFCFVEDSTCSISLLSWVDVGAGLNSIETDEAFDVPYTQFRVGGGVTFRPIKLAKKTWHPWAVGPVVSWSLGSGSVLPGTNDNAFVEKSSTRALRFGVVNQLWLGPRRNGFHLDATLGLVRSGVFNAIKNERYSGFNAEFGVGFGGWGGVFVNGDFLDGDTRIVFGFKGHAIAAAPVALLVISGLLLGGVNIGGGG